MTDVPVNPSYRALLDVPTAAAAHLGVQLAHIAQSMLGAALIADVSVVAAVALGVTAAFRVAVPAATMAPGTET